MDKASKPLASADQQAHDIASASSYSALLHPNADPSVPSDYGGDNNNQGSEIDGNTLGNENEPDPKQLGCFKRMFVWIDQKWLKPLLVNKNQDQIKAAD